MKLIWQFIIKVQNNNDFKLRGTIRCKIKGNKKKKKLSKLGFSRKQSLVNRCWDLFFIKLDWKSKLSSKSIFDLALGLDLISLQIRLFNQKY